MNRFKVYLLTMKTCIEFSDGKLDEWDEKGSPLYCFNDYNDALKHRWARRREEANRYRKWLKKSINERGCFLHHTYEIQEMYVF